MPDLSSNPDFGFQNGYQNEALQQALDAIANPNLGAVENVDALGNPIGTPNVSQQAFNESQPGYTPEVFMTVPQFEVLDPDMVHAYDFDVTIDPYMTIAPSLQYQEMDKNVVDPHTMPSLQISPPTAFQNVSLTTPQQAFNDTLTGVLADQQSVQQAMESLAQSAQDTADDAEADAADDGDSAAVGTLGGIGSDATSVSESSSAANTGSTEGATVGSLGGIGSDAGQSPGQSGVSGPGDGEGGADA